MYLRIALTIYFICISFLLVLLPAILVPPVSLTAKRSCQAEDHSQKKQFFHQPVKLTH